MMGLASMHWVRVSDGEARSHPHYGLSPILFLFYMLTLGGLLVRAAALSVALDISALFNPADVHVSGILLAVGICLPLPLLVGSLAWRQLIPAASIACIWGGVALDAGSVMLGLTLPVSLVGLIASTLIAPFLTYYVLLSKRINVTYRHRVRRSDPFLAAPA